MRKLIAAGALTVGLVSLPSAAHAGHHFWPSLGASATQVVAGQKIVFKGIIHPRAGAAGQPIVLQEQFKPGAPWADKKHFTVGPHGRYRISDRPTTNFVHSYRVVIPATVKHAEGTSNTVQVKVYDWEALDSHTAVNWNSMSTGTVDIDGTPYDHSVLAYDTPASLEYNLDHQCIRLRATFGISDGSTAGGQAEVDVDSDGTNVYTHTFDLSQSDAESIVLASPLKIRLSAQSTSTGGPIGYGAFGTAQVLCID